MRLLIRKRMAGAKHCGEKGMSCSVSKKRKTELEPSSNINATTSQTEPKTELSVPTSLFESESCEVSSSQTENMEVYDSTNAEHTPAVAAQICPDTQLIHAGPATLSDTTQLIHAGPDTHARPATLSYTTHALSVQGFSQPKNEDMLADNFVETPNKQDPDESLEETSDNEDSDERIEKTSDSNNSDESSEETSDIHDHGEILLSLIDSENCDQAVKYLQELEDLDPSERQYFLTEALRNIFRKYEEEDDEIFTETEIIMIQKLLENGADTKHDEYEYNGHSPLSIAVKVGSCAVIEMLCQHAKNIHQNSNVKEIRQIRHSLNLAAKHGRCDMIDVLFKYNTEIGLSYDEPLCCAFGCGQLECAKFLIEKGAQIKFDYHCGAAINSNQSESVKFIMQNCEQKEIQETLKKRKFLLNNFLINAAEIGNIDIIGHILDVGADVNKSNQDKLKPLFYSRNEEVLQFLIHRGAEVNQVMETKYGIVTYLVYILSQQHDYGVIRPRTREIIQILLQNGACINARDFQGRTALMLAARLQYGGSLLQMLLDYGPEVTDRDYTGETPLMHARFTNNSMALIQFTKQINGCFNIQDNEGDTALMCAARLGSKEVLQELIEHGADVNIKNEKGNTALLCAVTRGCDKSKEIVTILINAGSDINCQNNDGLSPLMLAGSYEELPLSILTELLDAGADINAVNQRDSSRTAISYCVDSAFENDRMLELFLDRGANSSYVKSDTINRLIKQSRTDIIPKLIYCGLAPTEIISDDPCFSVYPHALDVYVSPLRQALLVGNVSLARYFMENLFLTATDVTYMTWNTDIRRLIYEVMNRQSSLDFFYEISSQPMSLFSLAFVSVSSCLGTGPGRENRVDMLPLPRKIKDRLLFKTEEVKLGPV